MEKKKIIGIMGPGEGASFSDKETATEVGKLLAKQGYIVLTGGRASGVMEAAMKGAKSVGGTTIGILPSENDEGASKYVDIAIKTGIGSARNNINVLTSDVVIAVGVGAGTTSEIALAIKAKKPVILLNWTKQQKDFFSTIDQSNITFCNELQALPSVLSNALI